MSKRVLIACEFSGIVREAFNAYQGINAISCDILPAEDGRTDFHYQGDVRDLLKDKWDAMIFFAPCTRLANSGVRWLRERNLWDEMREGAEFFNLLLNADIPLIGGENPIQHKYARQLIRKYDQIIQPYHFGHLERKATCIWVNGLPKLKKTNDVYEQMKKLPKKEQQKVHYMSPSEDRGHERSRTYSGIAQAMASQWVPVILSNNPVR